MQWLNKVDDALNWVLGPPLEPPPQTDGDDNSEQTRNRADHDDDDIVVKRPAVGRAKSNSVGGAPKRSPVVIHEDYTCPSTPMAAAVGEYLVLDESPYPSANYNGNRVENKLPSAKDSAITMQRNASVGMQQSADELKGALIISHRGGNRESNEAKPPTKLPPPPPPLSLFQSSTSLSSNKQQPKQKQAPAPPPPPPTPLPHQRNAPSSPRRIQSNPYKTSRSTPRGSRAAPGVIRRRLRTPSISPPPSPASPLLPHDNPIVQTIESFGLESEDNDHHLISQPILLPSHNNHSLNNNTIISSETERTPPSVNAVSFVPPPPLSPPPEPKSNIEKVQSIDNAKSMDNKVIAETEAVEIETESVKIETEQSKDCCSDKTANAETSEADSKDDNWHLRGWFSSSNQEEPDVGVEQRKDDKDDQVQIDDDDSSSADSFHSHFSGNSQLINNGIEGEEDDDEEEEADNESTFERDYADFAIPFPSSPIIQDDLDWDPSLNCYGIVHVRLLRAQRLPCDEHATVHATLSLPPWKGRIRIPPRAAKRGPTGAGICSRWDKPIDKKEDGGGAEGESPPLASEAEDPCTFHMVHAYNNEDTPIPTVSLELSVAKLGGVFEKFLCSVSFPCHGLMQSPGSWIRDWHPASRIFGVNEVDEGADLDTLPFILLETCFEPKVEDAAEAAISEEDTLGSIPRDFEIRPSPRHSNLQHMPDSIYSSVDDESTSLMSGITSRNVASTKPHLLRVRSFWAPAWCAVCSKVITTGWLQGSFECEACHIYCCRDCQLQVDVRIPCGSELSAIAVKKAKKYQISLGQIMTTLAPQDENGKPPDVSGPADTTNLGAVVRSDEDSPRDIKGIGILNIRVLKACLFDKTYPSETEPSSVFDLDSSNLRSGDHYVRVSWMGSRDSKRTKTVLQASKPVFDSDDMVFDVPHYGMEYKVEVVDANTDRPVGSCLLSAQGLLQWQRDDLLSSLDRLLLSFFHFREYSEPRRLRLELRKGVKDGFGLNFYNSAKLTEGSNEANSSMHAGEISGWIDLDLHLQEDRKLFYSLEPRRCPPKAEEEFDIALIQLHIARIGALVEDIQKLVSAYMYLVGWENDKLTGTALVSLHVLCALSIHCYLDVNLLAALPAFRQIIFVVFTLTFNMEYLGTLPIGVIVLYMVYLAYLRVNGRFKDRFISKEKDALIESEKKIEKNHSIHRPIGILEVGELRGKHLKTRELGLPGSFYATISYDPMRYADEHAKASLAKIDASSTCSHQIGSTISPGITSNPIWTNFQDSAELMRVRYLLPDDQTLGRHLSQDVKETSLKVMYPVLQPLTEDGEGIAPVDAVDGGQRSDVQLMPWESSYGAIVIQVRFSDVLGTLFDNVLGEVVVPVAKLAGSGRAVEGWFRLLDVGTTDFIPGDSTDETTEEAGTELSVAKKGEEDKELPQIELPEIYLKAKFSPNFGDSSSDLESSKVICEELVRTASLSQGNGVGVIGSSLSTLNTVRTLGGTLQNQISFVVDMIEKARNAFNFSNPRITVLILLCLSVLWTVLALIPTRIVILIGGVAQFGATYYDKYMSPRKKKREMSSEDKKTDASDVGGNVFENMFLSIPTDEDLRRTYFWEARRVGEREREKYAMAKRQTRVEKLWKARWHGSLVMKEKKADANDTQNSSARSSWSWKGIFALIEGHRFIWWRSEKHFDTGESPLGQIFFAGHSGLAGLSPLDLRELTKEEIPSVVSIFGRGQQGQQKITMLAPSLELKDSLENAVLFASTDAKAD
eukprot:scaffold19714_cov144-Skeletonema_dohrnii-CCMP3373.AAC.1